MTEAPATQPDPLERYQAAFRAYGEFRPPLWPPCLTITFVAGFYRVEDLDCHGFDVLDFPGVPGRSDEVLVGVPDRRVTTLAEYWELERMRLFLALQAASQALLRHVEEHGEIETHCGVYTVGGRGNLRFRGYSWTGFPRGHRWN